MSPATISAVADEWGTHVAAYLAILRVTWAYVRQYIDCPDDLTEQTETIKLETREDGVAIAWLANMPMNAISPQVINDLRTVWERLKSAGKVRALVIASAIPVVYSAGADIKAFTKMDEAAVPPKPVTDFTNNPLAKSWDFAYNTVMLPGKALLAESGLAIMAADDLTDAARKVVAAAA